MSEDRHELPDLREAEAVAWYRAVAPLGPHLLDSALTGLNLSFEGELSVAAVAPVAREGDEPTSLFIAVEGDVSDDRVWERLVRANEILLEHAARWNAADVQPSLDRLHLVVARVDDARPLEAATTDWFTP